MLDVSHLPSKTGVHEVQTFNSLGANDWQIWRKPLGRSMGHFMVICSGAGGGGGFSAAAASARGGGGGGGCGAVVRVTIPLILLPDILYIQVPLGGAGGAAGAVGGSATANAWVSLRPSSALNQTILARGSEGSLATGGGAGTGAAGGAGGAGSGVSSQKTFAALGQFAANSGLTGAAGGAQTGAVGTAVAWGATTLMLCPGAGGAGVGTANTAFAGGAITNGGTDLVPAPAGGVVSGGAGQDGFSLWLPLAFSGGAGGASHGTVTGGKGGDAGIGCGGGGGGGGVTGGAGGRGGNGLVIVHCW